MSGGGYTTFNYQYDAIGNMIYKSDVGVMAYGTGAGPHALTSAGGYNYQYDANGNMISGKNKTMEYDAENRLTKTIEPGRTTQFVYDGDGGRVKKYTVGSQESVVYIGSLFEVATDAAGAQTLIRHLYAGSQKIVSLVGPTDVTYYHPDHLGSSSIMTDASGNQLTHYEYTPYGAVVQTEGADSTPYKFTGKELDQTGLYFYGARYYDPVIGRFITADTIVQAPYDPQSLNRYSYCRNNPLNYVDPSGHSCWKKFVDILVSVVATVVINVVGIAVMVATAGSCGFLGYYDHSTGNFAFVGWAR